MFIIKHLLHHWRFKTNELGIVIHFEGLNGTGLVVSDDVEDPIFGESG